MEYLLVVEATFEISNPDAFNLNSSFICVRNWFWDVNLAV
jgi:hypothetical protein